MDRTNFLERKMIQSLLHPCRASLASICGQFRLRIKIGEFEFSSARGSLGDFGTLIPFVVGYIFT